MGGTVDTPEKYRTWMPGTLQPTPLNHEDGIYLRRSSGPFEVYLSINCSWEKTTLGFRKEIRDYIWGERDKVFLRLRE